MDLWSCFEPLAVHRCEATSIHGLARTGRRGLQDHGAMSNGSAFNGLTDQVPSRRALLLRPLLTT